MIKEFITYNATDGCLFPGCLYKDKNENDTIAIFVYGNNGNFYKIKYLDYIGNSLLKINIDFLSADNRGREQYVTNYKINGNVKTKIKIGTMYEDFNESLFDIKGMINFVKEKGYENIILIGESLGTVKVLNYCLNNTDVDKIILLSPIDTILRFKNRVKEDYDILIEKAKELVLSGKSYEFITSEYSAIKVLSTNVYNSSCDILRLEENREDYILKYNGKVSFIVGEEDHCSKDFGMKYLNDKLSKRFENAKYSFYHIEGANHSFSGKEEELANLIVKCVKEML